MEREEIRQVLQAILDPDDPAYPGSRYEWLAASIETVREIVARKGINWSEQQIMIVGVQLFHPTSESTLELMENILEAEEMIRDVIVSLKPAYLSTLIIHNVTFYLGVALILASVYTSYYEGRELFSAVLGGVGLATIIFLFFREPIRGVQRSLGNLIGLEVIYNSYTKQIGYWRAYYRATDVDIKRKVISEIEKCTQRTMQLIQEYCERTKLPNLGGGSQKPS